MKVINTIAEMKSVRAGIKTTVGFVPTMGFLHEGHLELVRRSKAETGFTVVSIFVNPTQFGPNEDFESYPRDTESDLSLLKGVKTNAVFMPTPQEMYPPSSCTWVDVTRVTERLEGAIRPGHFRGVATVVAKLFNIVRPSSAYFGQKDAQQVVVIKRMVNDLNMNLEVVVVPTVREPDGLAMSSRNVYLKPPERKAAAVLYKSLMLALRMWERGEKDAGKIREAVSSLIQKEPLAKLEYVSIADQETLQELSALDRPAVLSLAVKIGKPRLIDNILLG